jgi:hypothetical protein
MTRVNFVYSVKDLTTRPTFYAHINPIKKYLAPDQWSETDPRCRRDAVNLWITTSKRISKIQFYQVEGGVENIIDRVTFDKAYLKGELEVGKKVNVFMSHGIADKNYRNYNSIKDFDYVCTSGPLWTQKYIDQGVPSRRILEIGYPKLDPLFNGEIESVANHHNKIKVLWAPTHGGKDSGNPDLSSYPMCYDIAKKFPSEFEVTISPHPRHKHDKGVTLQELLSCDVVISDTGSLVYEAMIMGKPVVFPTYLIERGMRRKYSNPKNFENYIFTHKIGYHANSPKELIDLTYLASKAGLDKKARQFAEGILPTEYRGTSGKRVAEALSSIDIENRIIFNISATSDYYATLVGAIGYYIGGVDFQIRREKPVNSSLYQRLKNHPLFKVRRES